MNLRYDWRWFECFEFVVELCELTSPTAAEACGGLVFEQRHQEAGTAVDHLCGDRCSEAVRRHRRRLGQSDIDVGQAGEEESGVIFIRLVSCAALRDHLRSLIISMPNSSTWVAES